MKGAWHFLAGYVKESGLQSFLALFFRDRDGACVENYVGSDEHLLRDDFTVWFVRVWELKLFWIAYIGMQVCEQLVLSHHLLALS